MSESYALLAAVRQKELPTRLVLAFILSTVAYVMAPSILPIVWMTLVGASQAVDWLAYRSIGPAPSRREIAIWGAATCSSSLVYSTLSVYLWLNAGDVGRTLAVLIVSGSLLHVTVHMHHVRGLLVAAAAPHALVFVAMPVSAALAGQHAMWSILLGAALYIAHLAVAFRQAASTTGQLKDERNRAEQASKAKSDFLATMSHEIRTPMNAIVSAANLLKGSKLNRAQREQVEILTDANDVLLSLLNDVLDLSKIEAGKMNIEAADVDLTRKLAGLQRLWQSRATDKGLDLRLEISPDAPRVVVVDPLRLKQVLFNLISNAMKFTQAGSVTLRLSVGRREAADTLVFEVIDTGDGIPAEVLPRLFGAFEQGDAGTTRAHGGSGLGLAISRKLADLMEGTLEAESEPGRGSTFRLTLPLRRGFSDGEVADDEDTGAGDEALSGLRVLAAEDHPVNRRILELLLAPMGCDLTFCEDGQKAVELAAVQAFDAILMDMQMPVLDGIGATRQIRAGGGPNAATPIIALTANALDHHRSAWAEVGVVAFVSKPIDPRQLAACLSAAASRTAASRAA